MRVGDSGRAISRGDFVGNFGVAGVSAGGLGVGVGAILRAVHGVTRLLGDPAGSSPGAFAPTWGGLRRAWARCAQRRAR